MSESIGASLRAAREKRRLTLAAVSESTRIRTHYLQALENDDLSAMPSAAQGRGFLKIYAQFLGLDLSRMIPPAAAPSPVDAETKPSDVSVEVTTPTPNLIGRMRQRLFTLRRAPAGETETSDKSEASPPAVAASQPTPDADTEDKKKASG